jgi:hypothetical protein
MVEITLSVLLQIVQTIGILVGIAYYLTIMRNTQRTRQTELLLQRHKVDLDYARSWADVLVRQDWTTMEELEENYPWETHFEERARVIYLLNTFNTLGLILREKVADSKVVFDLYPASNVITTWLKFEGYLGTIRARSNDQSQFSGFEYLYNEAKRTIPYS